MAVAASKGLGMMVIYNGWKGKEQKAGATTINHDDLGNSTRMQLDRIQLSWAWAKGQITGINSSDVAKIVR